MTEKETVAHIERILKKRAYNRQYHALHREQILVRQRRRRAEAREHREAVQFLSGLAQLSALSKLPSP